MRLNYLIVFITVLTTSAWSNASDYKIEIFKENYRESPVLGAGGSKIYHTIQAKTIYGNKLFILVGNDYGYRKWLRGYIKRKNLFLIKIPDEGDNTFQNELAIPINIQQIHPISEKKWRCDGCRHDTMEK